MAKRRHTVRIRPYTRVVDGEVQHVSGYTRDYYGGDTLRGEKEAFSSPVPLQRGERPAPLGPRVGGPTNPEEAEQEPLYRDGLTPDTAIKTDDPDYAAQLLGTCRIANDDGSCKERGYYVTLTQPRGVSVMLDKLAEWVHWAQEQGGEVPHFDLCRVTVPKTNLFCAETKGVPRVQMPQLGGKPRPGSPADHMPKDKRGEVDLSEAFTKYLEGLGYDVVKETVDASMLRVTQTEIDGTKSVMFSEAIRRGDIDTQADYWRIWTTGDDYIIDGHHRWSGTVAAEFQAGQALPVAVYRAPGLDIVTALKHAVKFTTDMGVPPLEFGKFQQGQEELVYKND